MDYKKKIIFSSVFSILLIACIFFGVQYFVNENKIKTFEKTGITKQANEKVINFAKLFIVKVLKANSEVPFEERLKLENAVRELNDKEILTQWEEFTSSKTEQEAQQNVKDLLELLINKISY